MSFYTNHWAMEQEVPSSCSHILLLLANYADDAHYCYPSQLTLARYSRMSERSVRRCLEKLERWGLISREVRRRHNGCYLPDGYLLHVGTTISSVPPDKMSDGDDDHRTDPPEDTATGHLRHSHRTSATQPPDKCDIAYNDEQPVRTASRTARDHPLPPQGSSRCGTTTPAEAVVVVPAPLPEPEPDPLPEPNLKPLPATLEEATERPPPLEAEFESLWRGWVPVEVPKGSKQDAKKAFLVARKGASYESIISGCAKYLDHCHATNCRTSHIGRWLQKRRWTDEYPAATGPGGHGKPALTSYERGLLAARELTSRKQAEGAYDTDLGANF